MLLLLSALAGLTARAQAQESPAPPSVQPPALLADSPARYPPEAAAEAASGVVRLELLVDAAGRVQEVRLVSGVHPLLDDAAQKAARGLLFAPATLAGQPVAVRLGFEYRFEPPRPAPPTVEVLPAGEPVEYPVSLRGLVRARGNRRPIPGAVVVSEAPGASAAEAGRDGRFEARLPPGRQQVRVTAPGYKPGLFEEEVRDGERLEVVYGLEPLVVNPFETVVHGERERTEVSRVTLREQELREVPGTLGDPFRVVMLLPGVGSMMSGISYPVVRGSQPAATGYFLDGVRVPILFHLFLGPAVVHPDFIDAVDFFAGTPPTRYGRLTGGAIEGRLSRPRDDRLHGSAYADLMNAGAFVEYPFQSTGTNVSVAGRYSYATPFLVPLAQRLVQGPASPGEAREDWLLDFWDYQARLEQRLLGGQARLFVFGSSDRVGTLGDGRRVGTRYQGIQFHRADLRHRQPLGAAGELELGATWGIDFFDTEVTSLQPEGLDGGRVDVAQRTESARLNYKVRFSEGLLLSAGGDVDRKRAQVEVERLLASGLGRVPQSRFNRQPLAEAVFSGGWAELQVDAGPLRLLPGLRVDSYHLEPGVQWTVLEPRLALRAAVRPDLTLKAGAGLYHQTPTTLISLPVVDVASLRLGVQRAAQFSVGAEWTGLRGLDVGLDLYVNPLLRTIELNPFNDEQELEPETPTEDDPDPFDALPDFRSRGLAYGLELLVRHPLGDNWFGWLSYSLQRSTRRARYFRYDASGNALGTLEGNLPFAFDQTHVLNLVLSRRFPGNVTVGGVFHFNSGRPEAGNLTSQTMRAGLDPRGQVEWQRVSRDEADRLPSFFRFDLRVSKTWAFDTFTLDVYADMLNVTLRREVAGFDYTEQLPGQLVKEAFGIPLALPVLGVKGQY